MAIASECSELWEAIKKAITLPPNVIWVEIRFGKDEAISARCGYYPDELNPDGTQKPLIVGEYELVRKESKS